LTEQSQFNADMTALTAFLQDIPTQLAAIQAELASRGITDISSLDSLVQTAQALQPQIDALGTGASGGAASGGTGT
jgi:hypothetical protein